MFSVIEAYEPSKKGDLKLNIGDKVDKVKDIGNGWVIGRNVNTRKKGSFPEDYIDRNTSITGALVRRFTNRSRSVKPTKDARINVIENELQEDDTNKESSEDLTCSVEGNQNDGIEFGNTSDVAELEQSGDTETQGTRRFRCLCRVLIRILSAIVAGGIVFALLVYSFSVDILMGSYIGGGVFIFLFFGLIFSAFIRCVVLIMVPNMFTKRGKAILLSVITGLLLSGPAMNVSHNTEEVGQSLGCTAELIYNQTQMLRKQLEEPIKALKQQLIEYMKSLENFLQKIYIALEPIFTAIRAFSKALKSAVDAVMSLARKCKAVLGEAGRKCNEGNDEVKRKCKDAMDKADPTSKVKDVGNKIKDVFGGWGRRKRSSTNSSLISHTEIRHLVRRGVLNKVCRIFDLGSGVCSFVNAFSALCSPIDWLSKAMGNVADTILNGLNKVTEFFEFKIKDEFDISGSATSSKSASSIVNEIKEDLLEKTEFIRYVFSIVSKIMSVSLILLFLSSLSYVIRYRTKLDYDNKYITRAFTEYDEECRQKGMESVLPLRKKEAKKYLFTATMKLSMSESSSLKKSIAFLLYHIIITLIVISFDYILYYVLLLIEETANVALVVEGENTLDVQVEGRGIISAFVRHMVSSMNLDSTYSVQFNFTICLPNPREPKLSTNILIGSLYALAIIILILEAYGSRLRRKITASFYPKQEKNRISYLHEKIISDRIAFACLMKDQVFRRRKENEVRGKITVNGYFSRKGSCMSRCCDCCLPEKRSCHCCDVPARKGRLFVKCQNEACNAVFCKECFIVMEGTCLVCDRKLEEHVV
ncbi:hypothetical protein FSP39_008593 [Pinctada imbricata]|uniref:SH3 domain-containing protein n=1 Tax=Pinctada imbricata TaxID=66713 RepID=A0AA88YQF7_PINIB|nr:hypothetical protein FSP39_008593 [Pinctada imbricata]